MTPSLLAPLLLLAAMLAPPDASFANLTQTYYAQKNAEALEALLARAEGQEAVLLCRYRLYPLTEDDEHLDGLPKDLDGATAREQALLAGLWGYRASRASFFNKISYGRRSQRLIEEARAQDPLDPFVLLIEGQSLLFRPAIAGGDARAALKNFEQLRSVLDNQPDVGIAPLEAALWTWYALEKMGDDRARPLREKLLSQNPPPLYRDFLLQMEG